MLAAHGYAAGLPLGQSRAIGGWRDAFDGRSVSRTEPDYESWRQAMPWQMYTAPRYPDMIARPASSAAIPELVATARKAGLRLAVKSGGHNVSEAFLRDGGILLDLGELQVYSRVSHDARHQQAHAGKEPHHHSQCHTALA